MRALRGFAPVVALGVERLAGRGHEFALLGQGLAETPTIPTSCQWATFLRNHDEIDLSGLSPDERAEVFEAFGPSPGMQLYDRGIRRRLAPMLKGDRRHLELAYSLMFTLPGTPVLRYGDELGMGDDLALPERNCARTPMQWSTEPHAGFTKSEKPILPVIDKGPYAYEHVNAAQQRREVAQHDGGRVARGRQVAP